jgi:tRNA threonylcarbamoyl adenosine modification protein (Sua5/YciO/YrdC/YwlC family)
VSNSLVLDATDPQTWGPAIDEAVNAIQRGSLVVLPTDTGYGVSAEAFNKEAVAAIGAAKGRRGQIPPPVFMPDVATLDGLALDVPEEVRALAARFWPGPLTIVVRAQPSLAWDLGDSHGTVALRIPDHPVALALLRRTGPLAVTGAQHTGGWAPLSVIEAREHLTTAVAVYLNGGRTAGGVSSVIDATVLPVQLTREGLLSLAELREVVPGLLSVDGEGPEPEPVPEPRVEPELAVEPEITEQTAPGEQGPGEPEPAV